MIKPNCPDCKKRPVQEHRNSKWCLQCALARRKRPAHTLTPSQIREAKKMIGKMSREDISKELGVSLSNLKRAFRGRRLAFYNYCVANPSLVKNVNKYYETHEQNETARHFGLSRKQIDHIVYRYKSHKPKQIKWTDKQITELAQMAGLINTARQAKYFNRPGAHAGSITSAWTKKFGIMGGSINGMSNLLAKEIVTAKCPRIKTEFYEARRKGEFYSRNLCLWVDMEKHLKRGNPKFIKQAVTQMAKFQRWLFNSKTPRNKIINIINTGYPPEGEKK